MRPLYVSGRAREASSCATGKEEEEEEKRGRRVCVRKWCRGGRVNEKVVRVRKGAEGA